MVLTKTLIQNYSYRANNYNTDNKSKFYYWLTNNFRTTETTSTLKDLIVNSSHEQPRTASVITQERLALHLQGDPLPNSRVVSISGTRLSRLRSARLTRCSSSWSTPIYRPFRPVTTTCGSYHLQRGFNTFCDSRLLMNCNIILCSNPFFII